MLDLSRWTGRSSNEPDGLQALAEVRRGIASTGSDENTAILWLYMGLVVCATYPETAIAMLGEMRKFVGNAESMERAARGIARAAGDRQAG